MNGTKATRCLHSFIIARYIVYCLNLVSTCKYSIVLFIAMSNNF